MGKLLVLAGILLIVFGLIVMVLEAAGGPKGGALPGDIVLKRGNLTFYFPIATSLLASLILTLILWLIFGFRR